ncbi:type II toxin-antitoxin system HicB family antitoxin [Allopusillimonas ginsengisoli]|uniref:type II toxin-antitoxin system HicB family antitoxin n=1 Tax=Allopusillimonas ginsengisoli TaxID=453575 RepID=UPI0015D442E8|nr:type II toxin-antitoxin system HicB family antitoxin [Alcaligenaceae bacterium]
MAQYPAHIQSDGEGFTVSFRDIPEALTCGDTLADATLMATDALRTAMDFYFEDRRSVPTPSPAKKGETLIQLPASVWAKVLLLNEMLRQGITPAELARRLGTRPQDVNRIVNLGHATKIDTIDAALASLGRELEIALK